MRKITLLKAKDDHFKLCDQYDAIAGCTSCICFPVCSYYPFIKNVCIAEVCKFFYPDIRDFPISKERYEGAVADIRKKIEEHK